MSDEQKPKSELVREVTELRARLALSEAHGSEPVCAEQVDLPTAQALLRSSPVAIIILDTEGRVMLWSDAAERMFGWREAEVLGKPNPIVSEEDFGWFKQRFERELQGENSRNELHRRSRRDGSPIDVRVSTAPLRNEHGETVGVVGLLTEVVEDDSTEAPPQQGDLRQLLNNVYEGVWMVDRNGITTFANERMAQMLGYSVAEMIGEPAAQFVAEADREAAHQVLQRRAQGIAEDHEFWLPRKDGDSICVHISGTPMMDHAGEYHGALGLVTDITARKRMEQSLEERVQARTAELTEANRRLKEQIEARKQAETALRESESRFRLIAENLTDLICRHSVDGRYLYVSPSCRKLLGYEPEEMLGRSPYEFFHPQDTEAIRANHAHVLEWPEASTIQYRFRRKDGSYLWFETIAKAIRDAETGEVTEIHSTSRDVTSRREAEQQLRLVTSAVEQIGEMVLITDADLDAPGPHILYANPAFCQATGYSLDEVIGKTPRILAGPRTSRHVLDKLRQCLSDGEPFHGETVNYRKDGSEFILEWHISPLRDEYERITHWVAIQRDVTEQRRNEALARQRQNELAHVGRLSTMGEMASGLAHELNQPLAAIAIYVQGCIRRLQNNQMSQDELIDALECVKDQSQRASEIIRRLRDFVRKREPQRDKTDVNHLVHEVLGLMDPEIQRYGVRLDLDFEESLPPVHVDNVQIQQVVLNLVRNAIEAMEANAPADRPLTIRTCRDDEQVYITVADAGAGMSDEQLQRIFEPFFTTKDSGMGMGLNISQSIAQANDGRLVPERDPERGMRFHLSLPCAE